MRVVVVLQRLGGARLLACRSCGSLAVCAPHGRALHDVGDALGCDARLHRAPAGVRRVRRAGALRAVREGISSLTTRVAALLGVDAVEVSAATAEVPEGARVVVGTEAVLSRVRHAPLVCFADLDDYLGAPRAHGSLAALRAIGLAGRLVGARGSAAPGSRARPDAPAGPPRGHRRGPRRPAGPRRGRAGDRAPSSRCRRTWRSRALAAPGAAALAESLRADGVEVTEDRGAFLASAGSHRELCDALADVGRGSEPVRVEVDPPGR